MKIGHPDAKTSPTASTTAARPAGAEAPRGTPAAGAPVDLTPAAVATPGEASAQVKLSDAAAALLDADPSGSFDTARVKKFTDAIGDGTYKVNAEAIADKLLSNAQELLGKVSR